MASVCFLNAEVVVSQLWIEKKQQNINVKTAFYNKNMQGPSFSDRYKTAKNNFITSWAEDIIKTAYYIHGL